jgi:hypothetical protein
MLRFVRGLHLHAVLYLKGMGFDSTQRTAWRTLKSAIIPSSIRRGLWCVVA